MKYKQVNIKPEDKKAFNELEKYNIESSLPNYIFHYLYFKNKRLAVKAATVIRNNGYEIEIRLSNYDDNWLVYAKKKTALSEQIIAEMRNEFEIIAQGFKGEYDGWEVEVPKP